MNAKSPWPPKTKGFFLHSNRAVDGNLPATGDAGLGGNFPDTAFHLGRNLQPYTPVVKSQIHRGVAQR